MALTKVTYPMIDAQSGETTIIYVATTGSDSNNGLSPSSPKLTLQGAIDALSEMTAYLSGTWIIQLAAGTYARGRFPDNGLASENPIQINGPDVGGHPNVPTAIISEGANGVSAEGIKISQGTKVQCSNLKFVGFNGTVSSGGFTSGGYCQMYTINCHFTNCTWGISCGQHSFLDVDGGIFNNCGFDASANPYSSGGGIRGLFLTKFSIGTQNAGTLANGPYFTNNNFGVFAQEHIDGHLDWCTFEDNIHGTRLNICSRLNMSGSSFVRCSGAAVWAQENSVVSALNSTFGTGADANNINVICNTGAVCIDRQYLTPGSAKETSERCIERVLPNQTINSTSNTVLYTQSLLGNIWREDSSSVSGMKKLRFKICGTLNGTVGYKKLQARFGSAPLATITFTAAETGVYEVEGYLFVGDDPIGTQYLFIKGIHHFGTTTRLANSTPTEAMTSDTVFNLEALVENAADSILVSSYEVWIDGL